MSLCVNGIVIDARRVADEIDRHRDAADPQLAARHALVSRELLRQRARDLRLLDTADGANVSDDAVIDALFTRDVQVRRPTEAECRAYFHAHAGQFRVGDKVQVIGPFGATFLMPNPPSSNLLMICTGTGSAPMRAMTEYRRRRRARSQDQQQPSRAAPATAATGKLMLFFGARTKEELPYFGPLTNLPKDFIDTTFAFSRAPGQPKRYVQDAIRERAADVAALLRDDETFVYVCGVKGMEDGVLQALADVAASQGLDWEPLRQRMKDQGRLHFETY